MENAALSETTSFDGNILARRKFLGLAGLGTASAFVPSTAWAKKPVAPAIRWPSIQAGLKSIVDMRKAANALAYIGEKQKPADLMAVGNLGLASKTPVDADTLWRVYSMTKPITGMAAMMLVGEGKIKLDQPIADFLPEFASMRVLTDPEKSMDSVPAKTQITLRHLLTHTAGFGYSIISKGPLLKAYLDNGLTPGAVSKMKLPGLATGAPTVDAKTFSKLLGTMPLVAEPGTKWSYSVATDLLGYLIEVISGVELSAFFQQRFFNPLSMTSSFFTVPKSEIGRFTTNYAAAGSFLVPIDPSETSIYLDKPAFTFGGAGLVTSARDYDRFLAMLVGDGKLDGKRVMTRDMVALGTSNLLPAGVTYEGGKAGFGAGGRVGLGDRAGTFGWGGAAGTVGAVDRVRKLRITGMTQVFGENNGFLRDGLQEWLLKDLKK
jgi:CubicO group peptidase (beta-lactamase class C family)